MTLCQQNPDLKFERSPKGELIIMPPTGGETGRRNSELNADFNLWNRRTQLGIIFDSSTCFRLPNGALRSPDIAWVKRAKWQALTPMEREKFPPLCPDFVLELLSPSDTLTITQAKMREYLSCGAQLGWLINPVDQQVEIYRPDRPVEILNKPKILTGDRLLPDFQLDVAWLWSAP